MRRASSDGGDGAGNGRLDEEEGNPAAEIGRPKLPQEALASAAGLDVGSRPGRAGRRQGELAGPVRAGSGWLGLVRARSGRRRRRIE